MKIFFASRFEEFKKLRELIQEEINKLPTELNIEIIALDDNYSDLKSAKERSVNSVGNSDVLLLIIGDTYGNIDKETGLSITHLEYKKAVEKNLKKIVIYVGQHTERESFISDDDDDKLKIFKNEAFSDDNIDYVYSSYKIDDKDNDIYIDISEKIKKNLFTLLGDLLSDNIKNSNNSSQKNKVSIKLIEYVSFFYDHYLKFPLSLAEKINPKELKKLKPIISKKDNEFGIYVEGSFDNLHLQLNDKGKKEAEMFEVFNEDVVKDILINCDTQNEKEYNIFIKLTIKEINIKTIFSDFSHNLHYIIEQDKFPSNEKKALYYRILGYYYYDIEDYPRMRKSFKRCVFYLEKNYKIKSPSFYLDWATKEDLIKNKKTAIELYKIILDKYSYPEFKNRSTRIMMAIHYYSENNKNKALTLLSVENFELVRDKEFSEKIYDKFFFLYTHKLTKEATILKKIITELVSLLKNKNEHTLAQKFLKEVIPKINNFHFKENLIRSYIETDTEKAFVELEKLKRTEFHKNRLTGLYMDYYIKIGAVKTAIEHAEIYIRNNTDIEHLGFVYYKLALFYSRNEQWNKAKTTFEKLNFKKIKNNYLYAISLMKNNDEKALTIFQNYFIDNPKTENESAISKFVGYCIIKNKKELARKYIANKFLKSKNYNYSRRFYSFLYQQQLKLTDNYDFSETLLKSAIKYADKDKQKAIVYSNFAKHLSYNELDDTNAIIYFEKSYKLKEDPIVLLDIAKCYFRSMDYDLSILKLDSIKTDEINIINEINLLRIKNFFEKKDFDTLIKLTNENTFNDKSKSYLYSYLSENPTNDKETTLKFLEESVAYSQNNYSKLKYAIYLFKNVNKNKGLAVFREIENVESNFNERQKIYNKFNNSINFEPIRYSVLLSFKKRIASLKKRDPELLNSIKSLISEHKFNDKLYCFLFDYHFNLKEFSACSKVLDILIKNHQLNYRTAELFFRISKKNYEYSNYKNFDKNGRIKIKKNYQVTALINAKKYIEVAIRVSENNFKYQKIYSQILFKQGNFKKYESVTNFILRKHRQEEIILPILKKDNMIFLWPEILSDYNTKINFYKTQEKVAAAIIGNKKQNKKMIIAVNILKSIYSDTEFNKENSFYLLRNITTRLGHYYYHIEKDFEEALKYIEKVYIFKKYDYPFIRSYIKTISILKKNKLGIERCEMYLQIEQTPFLLRHYGNFLKDNNKFKKSYDAYIQALILEKDNNKKHKGILYHNILLLIQSSLQNSLPFIENYKEIAINAYKKVKELYPNFKYIEDSTNAVNFIKKY